MENFNLGAVLFALLIVLWLAYALPRTAARREVLGRAREIESADVSASARDLSDVVRARRPSPEETPHMTDDRLLLRPADPTRRPRFDDAPGTRIEPLTEQRKPRTLLIAVLALLTLSVLAVAGLAAFAILPWWTLAIPAGLLGLYLLGLRRAEIQRRNRRARAAREARQAAALEGRRERAAVQQARHPQDAPPAELEAPAIDETPRSLAAQEQRAAEQVMRPGEWMPRPVPLPTYALRGEVDDLATRHAQHRAHVVGGPVPLEREDIEEVEAQMEEIAPAADIHLDDVLARRRA